MGPDHDDDVAVGGHSPDGLLAVLAGITDVRCRRPGEVGEAPLEGAYDRCDFVGGERGLRHESRRPVLIELEVGHVVGRADQPGAGNGAKGPLHLIVPSMADKDELAVGSGETAGLVVDLAHQGTGGIDSGHLPAPRLLIDARAYSVRREHDAGPVRHLRQFLHEDGAGGLEAGDDMGIVDDLAAHVHRWPITLQCPFDRLDGALHAGAKRPGLGQQDLPRPGRRRPVGQCPPGAAQAVQALKGAHGPGRGKKLGAGRVRDRPQHGQGRPPTGSGHRRRFHIDGVGAQGRQRGPLAPGDDVVGAHHRPGAGA